jgi:hypothetical protein
MCVEESGPSAGSGDACCSPDLSPTYAGECSESCPMAGYLSRMSSRPGIWSFVLAPGLVLVLVGLLILIAPQVLVWLLAGTSILLGLGLLWAAGAIRRWLRAPATT